MTIISMCLYFSYLLLVYLITTFDHIYLTSLTGGISEFAAYLLSGLIYEKLGVRKTYLISLSMGTVGGICIITYGLNHQDSASFQVFFLMCKFSTCCSYSMLVLANSTLFEL